MNDLPLITRSQLASRNGSDREEIWIDYKGVVYEVTESRHWRRGIHYGHWAGQDLTDELADAPHAEEVFLRFNKIGRIE
ncbi:MAG: cytochrome b5 domain-containing protein [Bacteroidia bacterium]